VEVSTEENIHLNRIFIRIHAIIEDVIFIRIHAIIKGDDMQ
jgi:hypothetical protein